MTKKFLWASAHQPTRVQIEELEADGDLVLLSNENPSLHARMCNCPSTRSELVSLAHEVNEASDGFVLVQPAGSPAFMTVLGAVMHGVARGNTILFSHSERVSEDMPQPDGSVKKVSIFKHLGWI